MKRSDLITYLAQRQIDNKNSRTIVDAATVSSRLHQ
jgi:hypothetical protein